MKIIIHCNGVITSLSVGLLSYLLVILYSVLFVELLCLLV